VAAPLRWVGSWWLPRVPLAFSGAGFWLSSVRRLWQVDLGFKAEGLITMEVLPLGRNPAVHTAYYSDLLRRLRAIPGVESAGLVDSFALGDGSSYTGFRGTTGERVSARVANTLSGYFETIGVSVREGRLPTDADYAAGAPGAVINESAARALFPGPRVRLAGLLARRRELPRAGHCCRTR